MAPNWKRRQRGIGSWLKPDDCGPAPESPRKNCGAILRLGQDAFVAVERQSPRLKAQGATGPEPPSVSSTGAALRLPVTGHSCIAQHFQRVNSLRLHPWPLSVWYQNRSFRRRQKRLNFSHSHPSAPSHVAFVENDFGETFPNN